MSFLIAVHVNEGIVLASDRRTTYNTTFINGNTVENNIGIHTTDSTEKTFVCPNDSGISVCGEATFLDKPITGFIQDMIRERISKDCLVESMPQIIIDYFNGFSTVPDTVFIIAGYDTVNGKRKQVLCKLNVKTKNIEFIDTKLQGATWEGETLTLTRLIQNVALITPDGKYEDLPFDSILWNYFTLQDAVDFARYAVEATIQTMRFKNVVETVGGSVDILVITPNSANWLQKEDLK